MRFKQVLVLAAVTAFGQACAQTSAQAPARAPDPAQAQVQARPKNQTPELSREQFEALLAHPENLLIIDVRRPDEVTKIGGFPVYLSIQSKQIEDSLAWIPKDRTIVTVSNHAARSGKAADFLASKGYKVAGTVGAQTFEEQGGKLTRIEIPPPRANPNGNTAAPAAANAGAAAPSGATRQ